MSSNTVAGQDGGKAARPGSRDAVDDIERELTLVVRRAQKVQLGGGPALSIDRAGYSVLARLHEVGPQRPSALADQFHLDASTITRQVRILQREGLVERASFDGDGRVAIYGLTDQGVEVINSLLARRRQLLADLLSSWTDSDRTAFADLLKSFNGRLDERFGSD
ncbi:MULTISPECIES: MarR family transcriptional regulator [unclassified Nocardioides]|uniref:MarR family winged helix-turn-helix transcriptional regulator n=1 Tax=unclassified Nocardioides TaxID=2615069 RepID=UPI0013051A0A|nr:MULTISPECIES: MarR family transcriptional regulator [unclassified Nocardioides]